MAAGKDVVMISPNFHPYLGGAEKQALQLSKALRSAGVGVRVLTRRLGNLAAEESVEGIPVRRLPAWGFGLLDSITFMGFCFAWLLANAEAYAAVHVHLAGSPAIPAALAGALLGKKVVVKLGGGKGIGEIAASSRTLAGRLKLRALAWLNPQFVAVTRDLLEDLRRGGLGSARVALLPNGVDTRQYRPSAPEEKATLRRQLGWGAGLVFLYVGRLSSEKRLSHFIEAFVDALRDTGADARLVLVGAGPEEKLLRELVQITKTGDRVQFHGPTDAIARVYRAADVFVLPSISEGVSNALLEAMASGLGILASRVGGTPEAVRDGAAGLLFEPLDRADLRRQLDKLLRSPALAADLGRAARADVAAYDLAAVAARYRELYGV